MSRPRCVLATAATAAVTLALGAPPVATAKQVTAVTICGASGCRAVHAKGEALMRFVDGNGTPVRQRRPAPFYRVKITIGGEGIPKGLDQVSRYIPSLHRLGSPASDTEQFWTRLEDPRTLVAYRRATRGITPYPASRIGALRAPKPPPSVPIEIYEPAKDAAAAGSSAGPSGAGATDALPWLLAGAGVVLLGGLGVVRHRRTRLRH